MAKDNWNILAKYVSGECSAEENKIIELWINADPEVKSKVQSLRNIYKATGNLKIDTTLENFDINTEWEELMQRRRTQKESQRAKWSKNARSAYEKQKIKRLSPVMQIVRVAAVLAIMIGGGFLLARHLYAPVDQVVNEPTFREISTRTSQLAGLELNDGSHINLSVASTIRVSDLYNQADRSIILKGQAYFEVKSDEARPFIVQAGKARITVLGTRFTVRSYPGDDYVEVVVVSGSVSVASQVNDRSLEKVIQPGELARMNTITGELTTKQVTTDLYLAWTEGRIVFEESSLIQVCRELERWFNVRFEIQDESLTDRQFTAILDSRSLSNVLDVLGQTLEVRVSQDDDVVRLDKM